MTEHYRQRGRREEAVKDAFTIDFGGDVGPVGAWTQTLFTAGLTALELGIIWNLHGAINLPHFGAVSPQEFLGADALISFFSGVIGAAFAGLSAGDVSYSKSGGIPGGILAIGLTPAAVNVVLPAIGGYGLRKGVEGIALRVARSLDKKESQRS